VAAGKELWLGRCCPPPHMWDASSLKCSGWLRVAAHRSAARRRGAHAPTLPAALAAPAEGRAVARQYIWHGTFLVDFVATVPCMVQIAVRSGLQGWVGVGVGGCGGGGEVEVYLHSLVGPLRGPADVPVWHPRFHIHRRSAATATAGTTPPTHPVRPPLAQVVAAGLTSHKLRALWLLRLLRLFRVAHVLRQLHKWVGGWCGRVRWPPPRCGPDMGWL
jgi:hypothetical protein